MNDPVIKAFQDGLSETEKTFNERIDSVKTDLTSKVTEIESDLEKIQKSMEEQTKSSGEVSQELKESHEKAEKLLTSMKERLDAMESKGGRIKGGQGESFKASLHRALTENKERISTYKENKAPFNIDLKDTSSATMDTKAIMTEADDLTGTVVTPTRVPGVKYDPERRVRIRQFLPQGTTNSNAIWYIQETAISDGTDVVAEGAAKPQSDLDLEQKSSAVTKIAAHFRVSEEMLEDIDYMASHISLRGTEKYFNKEDQQILYGTGTSNQLEGLTVSATDYTLGQYTDAQAQEYDILLEANKQLLENNYMPTANMISIKRYFDLLRRKDTDGRYILPPGITFDQGILRVLGKPIIATNALSDDDFLVADFPMLTTLFDRTGVNVRFYEQDQDNAVKNLVTVVIEARLALPTYLPGAGRYGDFANAINNAGNS